MIIVLPLAEKNFSKRHFPLKVCQRGGFMQSSICIFVTFKNLPSSTIGNMSRCYKKILIANSVSRAQLYKREYHWATCQNLVPHFSAFIQHHARFFTGDCQEKWEVSGGSKVTFLVCICLITSAVIFLDSNGHTEANEIFWSKIF